MTNANDIAHNDAHDATCVARVRHDRAITRNEGKHDMTKRNTNNDATNNDRATIALKTMHDDIMRDDATFTRTTKQMRVVLRAMFNDIHERNASWTFTQSQYDRVRSHFDAKYRAKLERASKRNTTKRATTSRKSRVVRDDTNDTNAIVVNNELHDANA